MHREELYCEEKSSIVEYNDRYTANRPFLEFTATFYEKPKIETNRHDTKPPNSSVFARREELLIPIGFGIGIETRISFC